ncbi:ABC transporter substrate-binding protein [Nocardioides sp.]|uniref:ABC transporter substrate-binding protein n=1 Tax=Nocardioides sp. TaxID=35761 RepID=UPI002611D446|nr:ABC transporter substrate-binding protein [Nocardioides sp.]
MDRTITINRRTLFQGTGAVALLAALAACGDSGSSKTGSGGSGKIDTLTVALPSSLTNLYPGKEAGIVNYFVATLVLEGLVAPDSSGALAPALAKSWKQATPTTYVYELREDATFSDGSAVTPEDIVYSVNLAKDAKVAPNTAYYWANVKGAKKTGPQQVTITLSSPDVAFAWGPTAANAFWVTAERFVTAAGGVAQLGTTKGLVTGTGPYKVTSFTPDSGVVLEATGKWWGGNVAIKKVEIKFIPEESTRILARESGDIDLAVNVSISQAAQWKKAGSTTVLFAPNRSYVGIDFNTAVAPFDDVHVRRAIAYAADRAGYVTSLLGGHGQPATALTTPEQVASLYTDSEALQKLALLDLPYDLDKAKAELAQSKVPQGFKTTVGVASDAREVSLVFQALAEAVKELGIGEVSLVFQALAEAVKELGIEIEIKEMPTEQWYGTIGSDKYGLAYMSYFNTTGDPAELPNWFLGAGNPASYKNPKVAALLAKATSETDESARVDELIEAQRLALADVAYLPLWWGEAAYAIESSYTIEDLGSYTLLSPWTQRIKSRG